MPKAIQDKNISHLLALYPSPLESGKFELGRVSIKHPSGRNFILDTENPRIHGVQENIVVSKFLPVQEVKNKQHMERFNFEISLKDLLSRKCEVSAFCGDPEIFIIPFSIEVIFAGDSGMQFSLNVQPVT
ncbi:hypothetical protein [Vibrio sp. D431a]|uniref:hypothetical protein n=1 Tax=Vibrio sp. D431a TaxID=2837388 RepID=UPI00255628FE|nr:hypothetical protein [Vibrio sp. D431a]MDK9793315.1 hypothetical protein [Vibrio sp. D431a]